MKRVICLLGVMLLLGVVGRAQAPGPTPVAQPLTFTASSVGSTLSQVSASYKPANTTITYHINGYGCGGCSAPANGVITSFDQSTGTLVYRPNSGFLGTDNFGFIVRSTTGGGVATDSPITAANVTVTNQKTTVTWTLKDPFGNPLVGTVGLFLSQTVDSPAGVTPKERVATATLDGFGKFTASVYPSDALFPAAAYSIWFYETATRRQWELGTFHIPASTGTVDLGACGCRELDANRAAQFVFASRAQIDALATQARTWDVQLNGVTIGSAPVINIQSGSGTSPAVTVSGGVANVAINCAACSGGSLASGTAGRVAYYSASNVVSDFAYNGAHKLLSSNFSNNGLDWKDIVGVSPITVTKTPGQISIGFSGPAFTLNSQVGTTQTLDTSFTGASTPTWSSSGNVHTLILPYAAPAATGLVNTLAQSFAGLKEFQGGLSVKAPGTLALLNSGGVQKGLLNDVGVQYLSAAFGTAATLGGSNALLVQGGPNTSATDGHTLSYTRFSLDNNAYSAGTYVASTSSLSVSQNNNAAHSQMLAGGQSEAIQGSNSGGSAALLVGHYASVFTDRGAVTDSVGFRSLGYAYTANAARHIDYLAEDYVYTSTGVVTDRIGFFAKYFSTGTNRYVLWSDQGDSGQAAAPISHGGALDLRGLSVGNAPAVSAANIVRQYYNSTSARWLVSENGGAYRNPLRAYTARNCSGAVSLDFTTSQVIDCTLTANVTSITVSGVNNGEEYTLLLRQNAGGTRTVASLGSNIKVNGGPYSSNSNTTTSNAVDVLKCAASAGNLYCVYLFDVK